MQKYNVTMKDIRRCEIIKDWLKRKINGKEASALLGVSYRHAGRLKKAFKEEGIKGLISKKGGGRNAYPESLRDRVAKLFEEDYGCRFNITHFHEKLEEVEDIHISYGTVRNILIEKGLHKVNKRNGGKIYQRRAKMPRKGMLIQMDSSFHQWLDSVEERWYLIAMVDDADNELLWAKFFPKDTVFNNMEVIRKVVEERGLFMALYVDRASHFKTTRQGGLHYNVNIEHEETNIEKALDELGITLIPANSPQAKGRIERDFGTCQDRLINELWYSGIDNYREANKFLQEALISYWNNRFKKEPNDGNVFKSPQGLNLDLIFTKRYTRTVTNDNAISFYNQEIVVPPSKRKLRLAKKKVEVRLSPKGKIWIIYKGDVIHQLSINKNNSLVEKEKRIKNILKRRSYD